LADLPLSRLLEERGPGESSDVIGTARVLVAGEPAEVAITNQARRRISPATVRFRNVERARPQIVLYLIHSVNSPSLGRRSRLAIRDSIPDSLAAGQDAEAGSGRDAPVSES
jgi:hypothetical protein